MCLKLDDGQYDRNVWHLWTELIKRFWLMAVRMSNCCMIYRNGMNSTKKELLHHCFVWLWNSSLYWSYRDSRVYPHLIKQIYEALWDMAWTLFYYRSANVTVRCARFQNSARIRSIPIDVSHCFHLVFSRYIHWTPPFLRAQQRPYCILYPSRFRLIIPKSEAVKT